MLITSVDCVGWQIRQSGDVLLTEWNNLLVVFKRTGKQKRFVAEAE